MKTHPSLPQSFGYALQGLTAVWRQERNFRIHVGIAVIVLSLAAMVGLTSVEWAILALAIGGMLAIEALNSALERLVDYMTESPKVPEEWHPLAKNAKDMAATACLVWAVASVAVGLALSLPHLKAR